MSIYMCIGKCMGVGKGEYVYVYNCMRVSKGEYVYVYKCMCRIVRKSMCMGVCGHKNNKSTTRSESTQEWFWSFVVVRMYS